MSSKGYESSNLLNYLDFSLDIELGDFLNFVPLKDICFGDTFHHRSAIFETAPHCTRIKDDRNYNAVSCNSWNS